MPTRVTDPAELIRHLPHMIRTELRAAQRAGTIPSSDGADGHHIRYDVRARLTEGGPKVDITINGCSGMITGGTSEAASEWLAGQGGELLAKVDAIRNAFNPSVLAYSGATKFGPIYVS